jgi:predicted phosphodiesterase
LINYYTEEIKELSKFPKLTFRNKKKINTPEEMVLLMGDAHIGLKFTEEETGKLGRYSFDVFKNRANNLRKSVIELLKLHSELREIPALHVFGLGDFVHGTQQGGAWNQAEFEFDIQEQSSLAGDVIAELLDCWSKYFKKVNFMGVFGNHGRAGVNKNSDKMSANWDLTAYKIAQCSLRDRPNITVQYSKSWWQINEVNSFKFLITHGETVKLGSGNLIKADIETEKMISARSSDHKDYQYLCLGHYHSYQEMQTAKGSVFINGSFVGGDMYSMSQLRIATAPSQLIFGVHQQHGVTWRYNLNLDYPRE